MEKELCYRLNFVEKMNDINILDFPHNKKLLSRFGNICDNNNSSSEEAKSALVIFKEELVDGCILSYNEKLDELLKNVILTKRIIEFSGHFEATLPVCLRLCVSVQLPKNCGGCGGEAFYISKNGNFSIEKLREIAFDFVEEYSKNLDEFNVEFILNHIYYTNVNTSVQLMSCIIELELFLKQKQIRLLVIDSITYILRQLEVPERFKTINRIFSLLRYLSDKYNLSVVITNFYTTRINADEAYLVPSFGDSFYHLVNSRICFSKSETAFHATLTKNVAKKEKEIIFQ